MKKHLSTILLVLVLLVGLGIMLYPSASDYWNSFHQSRAIASYAESVSQIDPAAYEKMWLEASDYNKKLLEKANPFVVSEEDWPEYEALLNIAGDGIMGYIEIAKINCALPIYHGTDESVLQIAVGHIQGSSLPVGGESTHTVLSGHRGLPSAKLFTDLDQLDEGDTFVLRILNETLTYQVDQIRRVLPNELDDLAIAEGRDFCTLVTCTPYGINTHRLLVRGKRIENTPETVTINITADAVRIEPILVAPVAAVPMLIVLMVFLLNTPAAGGKKKLKKQKGGVEIPISVPLPSESRGRKRKPPEPIIRTSDSRQDANPAPEEKIPTQEPKITGDDSAGERQGPDT